MTWLYHILSEGMLSDNQRYQAQGGVFSSPRLGTPFVLERRRERQWSTCFNDDEKIWKFLTALPGEMNALLADRAAESLVLFNDEEYEHNTDDEFVRIHGTDARNFSLQTGNLIGYVKRGDYALKIGSRFGDDFLRFIISDADGFVEVDRHGSTSNESGYEWLLAYLWLIKLKRAFRLGLPKTYVSKSERLATVKGTIDPVDYFLNRRTGKYLCDYREHSYRNSAAALFAEVYERFEHFSFLQSARSIYNTFVMANQGQKVSHMEMLATPHFRNPFYSDYNVLIDLSKQALRSKSTDFGDKSNTSAFLFDVSMLFEYFIRKLLKRSGLSLLGKTERRQDIPSGAIGHYRRKLEPDIVFELGGKVFVFDVKYKHYDFRYGVNREDLFQLHTYIGQYANRHPVGGCGFVYPISEQDWDKHHLESNEGRLQDVIHQGGHAIPFGVFFVKIPGPSAENFSERMKASCESFVRAFHEPILWP